MADEMTKALFGQRAVHCSFNMIVQGGEDGRVLVVAQSQMPGAHHSLLFGSQRTHVLALGDMVFRPHLVMATDALRGHGLTGIARDGFVDYAILDRAGRTRAGPDRPIFRRTTPDALSHHQGRCCRATLQTHTPQQDVEHRRPGSCQASSLAGIVLLFPHQTTMNLTDYIAKHRTTAKKPTADIRSRWASRIVARNLHHQGKAGADLYLRDYGKGISATKVIALAIQSECEGCDDLALGFWMTAYRLETGLVADATALSSSVDAPQPKCAPIDRTATSHLDGLPAHLQPGAVVTMQPVDAARSRIDYINDPAFFGQPKRDGSRIVIFATPSEVSYQSRSTTVLTTPSVSFDGAFRRAAEARGPFVLDGELVFIDRSGGEHRTGSQAAQTNAANGCPDAPVLCRIAVFKALFANGQDLTQDHEDARIVAAGPIVGLAQSVLIKAGVCNFDIEQVPTARTTAQKKALVVRQQAEGREGEVWIRHATTYLGGKVSGDIMVRTKYLEESEVVITGLTPTTVAGRPFGAIEVAESCPDGAGRPLGKVGSGFDAADAHQIAALVARHPEGIRIVVRHQGRTETGMLWHARFLRVVGPVGMAA